MSSTEQIATTDIATAPKRRKKRPIGFYISGAWVSLVLFLAIFGNFLPGPQWDESFYDSLGVAPFHKSHILGTTLDGYDMYSGLVHGARLSVFVALVAVIVGGAILGYLPDRIRFISDARLLVFGLVLIIVMNFRPDGLLPRKKREKALVKKGANS